MTEQTNFMFGDMEVSEPLPKGGVNDTVNIPVNEYKELLDDSRFLAALRSAGVDDWEGYDEAQEIFEAFNK